MAGSCFGPRVLVDAGGAQHTCGGERRCGEGEASPELGRAGAIGRGSCVASERKQAWIRPLAGEGGVRSSASVWEEDVS
jgi:hypothetical protein